MRKMFLFAFLGFALLSCSRHEADGLFPATGTGLSDQPVQVTVDTADQAGVTVSHGWLRFREMADFIAAMETLHGEYGIGILDKWEQQFPGYVSLRKVYALIDADDSYERTAPTVDSLIRAGLLLDCPDSRFATVLSRSGRIQIADTLYQFLPDQVDGSAYAIPERYIDAVLEGTDPGLLDGTAVHLTSFVRTPFPRWEDGSSVIVVPGTVPERMCTFPRGFMFNWWGQKGGDIYGDDNDAVLPRDNGRMVRLNYHRWRVSYIFYSSVGVRVKMWKHTRFAGWLSTVRFREAGIEACAKGYVLNHALVPLPFTASVGPGYNAYDSKSLEHTLQWYADPVISDIFLQHFNFRFRVDYRGHIMERFIRE